MLQPGDPAPSFQLLDQTGTSRTLSEFSGSPVLLFFYPKAMTPGCTNQAVNLRDVIGELDGATIIGMSPDTPDRQAKFDDKHALGYPLLSDPDHAVAEAYGVWGEKKMYGRAYMGIIRSAFLIDAQGQIAAAFYKISPKDTPTKLMAALRSLSPEQRGEI